MLKAKPLVQERVYHSVVDKILLKTNNSPSPSPEKNADLQSTPLPDIKMHKMVTPSLGLSSAKKKNPFVKLKLDSPVKTLPKGPIGIVMMNREHQRSRDRANNTPYMEYVNTDV